jgi:hypothetical protein
MRILVVLLLSLAGIVVFGAAEAEVIEVPLTGLNCAYTCQPSPSRTAVFTLRSILVVVRSVSIRLSGETTVRQWFCDLDPPFDLPVTLYAAIPDPLTGGEWYTYGVAAPVTGPFEMERRFVPYAPKYFGQPTWDFLRTGGSVTVYGGGAPIIDICWPIGELSDATVSGASLLVDGDFPIPVEPTTWGHIKSLFGE